MIARNANLAEVAGVLQASVLDKPVLDQTGLARRWDCTLNWTPDPTELPNFSSAPTADKADAPPDLYTAIQQQLGLKLQSPKALVDVLVIDHVERPSDN
jgi:uncharacterized protein (TIGR03435 family)